MPNDEAKRMKLVEKINANTEGNEGEILPSVTIEEFFDGNDDLASIGCNLDEHPGLAAFRDVCEKVRARPDVQDVRICIYETMEDAEDTWPYAEEILVITSADPDDVATWFESLDPSDIIENETPRPLTPAPGAGMKAWLVWWD
ncbi:MAG: hypothetical protein KF859_07910 [Phycisphaeraceae bacterium]|nr:hypothetical protein [Phycisphaeraceae bacterium]